MPPRIDPKDIVKEGFRLDKLNQNNLFTLIIVIVICLAFYYFFTSFQDSVKELDKGHKEQVQSLIDKVLQNCRPENIANNNNLFKN